MRIAPSTLVIAEKTMLTMLLEVAGGSYGDASATVRSP
jgi:hypothetical protein